MKKTPYLQPSTNVVLLRTIGMLAQSNIINQNGSAVLNTNTMDGGDGSDAARHHSSWDDEE